MYRRCCLVVSLVATMCAGLLVSAPSASAADPEFATISGTITVAAGTFSGEVILQGPNRQYLTARTGGEGKFTAPYAQTGTWTVSISGYLTPPGGAVNSGQFYIERKNIVVSGDTDLTFTLPIRPVSLEVTDSTGEHVTAQTSASCNNFSLGGDRYNFSYSVVGSGTISQWGLPGDSSNPGTPCSFYAAEGTADGATVNQVVSSTGDNNVTVVVPATFRLSGTQTTTDPAEGMYIGNAYKSDGTFSAIAGGALPNKYSYDIPAGEYTLYFNWLTEYGTQYNNPVQSGESYWVTGVNVTQDETRNFSFETKPLDLHFVDPDGDPVDTNFNFNCRRMRDIHYNYGPDGGGVEYQAYDNLSSYAANGPMSTATVRRPSPDGITDPWACEIAWEDGSPTWPRSPITLPAGDDMTIVIPGGGSYGGTPSGDVGDDGVSNVTEALGPNHGDGNGDGTPDADQANVTSLPANGAPYSNGVAYLTLAGPAGSTLEEVSTTGLDSLPAPPAGVTLPAGLVNFKLTGLTDGATKTVSIYPGDMTGVNGYAKWDGSAWSMLPADRVEKKADHLEVTLTDGGIGDADGAANGIIVDPGGVAKVAPGDSTPPTVTGAATSRPNAAGWYRGNVKVHWTATDASGVAVAPGDTTVSSEGANVTAHSGQVCDTVTPTPNCTTGTLTGLKIDKTAPNLSVTGVSNGATYTLGNVPGVGCAASDQLSGLAAACKGVKVGGNSAGVGSFGYAAAVSDKAGNTRAAAASWNVVYGFTGFLAPLNDPAVTPGAPTSIFKAGSTVPVPFSLKKSNGQVATPASKPVWVSPVKGARTTAAVNESVSNGAGTSGSAFVWRNNRWEFNWSTKGLAAGYLYRIGVRLDDGTTKYLTVGLR